jgi:NAD(P)-dependent dehydrogenase (short-subunit alcohol dehydrogenase family)
MAFDFSGQVAVVTGAGRGLGRAYAETLARAGARVCLAELDPVSGQATAAALETVAPDVLFVQTDVGDSAQVQHCLERVLAHFGRVDILINNAGNEGRYVSLDISESSWQTIFRVNLFSTFLCCQLFGREMIRQGQGGAIINVSSIASLSTFPGRTGYAAAKAGINLLTKVLAVEWAKYGIRVNAVGPGMTRTERFAESVGAGLVSEEPLQRRIPLGRVADPVEIANVVAFLASSEASYITGQIWYADGGWTARASL